MTLITLLVFKNIRTLWFLMWPNGQKDDPTVIDIFNMSQKPKGESQNITLTVVPVQEVLYYSGDVKYNRIIFRYGKT